MADVMVQTMTAGRWLVARVSGEMDHASAPALREQLRDLIFLEGKRFIVLDLSRVSLCNLAGLNVLLGAWRQANTCGAVLVLAHVPARLRQTLQRTGTDQVLRIYDTVDDAKAVFRS